jgi:hypothetical protein
MTGYPGGMMGFCNFRLKIEKNTILIALCTAVISTPIMSGADDSEHRLARGVTVAAGIGLEVTNGDYGEGADATVVTMPLLVAVNPTDQIDLSLELPFVFLSSKGGSNVVATTSGGAVRRKGAVNGLSSRAASGKSSTVTVSSVLAGSSTVTDGGVGDINLTAGYTLLSDGDVVPRVRPYIYLKAPSGDSTNGLGTGTFEGGPGISLSKWLGDWQIFADTAYIFQNSISDYKGINYLNYSAGIGLQVTDRLFASIYARGATKRLEGGTAPTEGRIKLNFIQSRRISWELYALAGFTDASPAAGGGLMLMYQF